MSAASAAFPMDRDRLALVDEIVAALPGPRGRAAFYDRLLAVLFRTMDVRRALLVLREPGDRRFRAAAWRNEEEGAGGVEVRVSRGILERVVEGGAALRLDDALADEALSRRASVINLNIRSVLCVPVPVRGRPEGALYADNRLREASFTEDDLAYLGLLGRLAGIVLENLDHEERLDAQNRTLRAVVEEGSGMVAVSPAMGPVLRKARLSAATGATVLITGESGVGKEVLAETIHDLSPRRGGPFVAVNCAALPDNLLEAELFGLAPQSGVAGAPPGGREGRFERAHGGTLFLDEIADMGAATQARILRAIEQREVERIGGTGAVPVDIRIVAATNKSPETEVRAGRLREDLYFRLRVVEIEIPPLRDRADDILPLAEHFIRSLGGEGTTLSPAARDALLAHDWPGNVRELRNVLERALVLHEGKVIEPSHLPFAAPATASRPAGIPSLDQVEREHIVRVLRITGGNLSEAAQVLGIARNTLYAKIDRYGLRPPGRGEGG